MPLWALALHQTAQVWKVEISLCCTKLRKPEKWGESKMIYCLEMALMRLTKDGPLSDLWNQRSEEKLRWFNALRWPCISQTRTKKKWFTEDSYLTCVYISAIFESLPHSTISYISGNKKKKKEADYNFVYQLFCCSSLYTSQHEGTFFSCALLKSKWCIQTVVSKWPQLGRNPVLYYQRDQISIRSTICQ